MFGYCGVQWESVISPAMPPRKIVDPLAGGYRRIPVMQIGADIFCDTKLIANEIAAAYNKPELSMETCADEIAEYSNYVDTMIFMAGIQSADPRKMLFSVFKLFSPLQAIRFIKDRAGIQKTSSLKRLGREHSLQILDKHFNDMESKLANNNFLFGDIPSIADFSAYHNLWFKNITSGSEGLESHNNINRWFKAMSEFGHGERTESNKANAFNTAIDQLPRDIPKSMISGEYIGKAVEIKPNDYAKNSVSGTLVGSDQARWILTRETKEFDTLHVHFPKRGFEIVVV